MRFISLVLFLLLGSSLLAQYDSSFVTTEVDAVIYAFDFKTAKSNLQNFAHAYAVSILNQDETRTTLNIQMRMDNATYRILDSLMNKLGYSNSKKVNTLSNLSKVNELKLELDYLKSKKESYNQLLSKLNEKDENYITLWNEQQKTGEKIFEKESELLNLNKKENTYTVSIELKDETTSPENTRVSFVNMPGIEYSYLDIESPKTGLSQDYYQGYFLKYLFTKGKSFGTIGVFKNNNVQSDSTVFSELFLLGFGQDFYSRHLGRGSRKFFNLYSGYTIGGLIATGKTTRQNIFFLSPSIGLELFKNKYFLVDSKVNYFVPLRNNRNLRGLSYNLSFNFVF